ncbi:hypothetical protein F4859DRAFT_347013 [Xylaria cf. heliscus]|nr:hypothetical protein F4859DRAFT_347013 [Xylaria cf. heliscus]
MDSSNDDASAYHGPPRDGFLIMYLECLKLNEGCILGRVTSVPLPLRRTDDSAFFCWVTLSTYLPESELQPDSGTRWIVYCRLYPRRTQSPRGLGSPYIIPTPSWLRYVSLMTHGLIQICTRLCSMQRLLFVLVAVGDSSLIASYCSLLHTSMLHYRKYDPSHETNQHPRKQTGMITRRCHTYAYSIVNILLFFVGSWHVTLCMVRLGRDMLHERSIHSYTHHYPRQIERCSYAVTRNKESKSRSPELHTTEGNIAQICRSEGRGGVSTSNTYSVPWLPSHSYPRVAM